METLILIAILAAGSIILERAAIKAIKPLDGWLKRYPLAGFAISLAFSWLLGLPFGARGLVVLGAGILSTAIMSSWYSLRTKWNSWKTERSLKAARPNWTTVQAVAQ